MAKWEERIQELEEGWSVGDACLLSTAWLLHSRIHSSCDYLDKICRVASWRVAGWGCS